MYIESDLVIELAGGVPALHPERKGQLERSPLKNWVEKHGGLPTYINSVATALYRDHPEWGISRVIATAVNWAKKVCTTGRAFGGKVKVSDAVKAAACAAVASWERKKASASDDSLDDKIIELSDENEESTYFAKIRKRRREKELPITDAIMLSDEDYFRFVLEEEWDVDGEGVNELTDIDSFMSVMELSASAQSAMRCPLNLSEAENIGGNKYKKEILRVGEIVVDNKGRKFNFTPKFLRDLKNNFGKALDYIPLLYTGEGNKHSSGTDPKAYAGLVETLSLDDEENPTKLYAEFSLTEDTEKIVKHNPKFGVSVTAHPNFVDAPRGVYYGPMLIDVNATHRPKLNKMGEWEKIAVRASDEEYRFDVLDLSDTTYTTKEEVVNMPEVETQSPIELSDEQIQAIMESDIFKNQVELAVADIKTENQNLRSEINNQKKASYETVVKAAVNTFRSNGENSVPPVLCDYAESLLLSFEPDERNEMIELSVGEEKKQMSKVEIVTKMLEETKGLLDLGRERGSSGEVELSQESKDEAVTFLAGLAGHVTQSE